MNFLNEGAQQVSSGKGHFYEENVNSYWNLKGLAAKAKGTTAIAVVAVGSFEACTFKDFLNLLQSSWCILLVEQL